MSRQTTIRFVLAVALVLLIVLTNSRLADASVIAGKHGAAPAALLGSIDLSTGWALRSANLVTDTGATISQVGYATPGWYPTTVPSTVLATLVANGVYNDIYYGMNLKSVPDLTTQNWWYRGEFTAPAGTGQPYWLRFKGLAYKAEIWLNGTLLDGNAVGTMVNHEYNVTSLIHPGAANALALKITPPKNDGSNLSFWYVDWNPKPPDMNAGIWGKVILDTPGAVVLRDPYVKTVLPLPATNAADLTVYVDAANGTANPVSGVLKGEITKTGYPTLLFEQPVSVNANERREIAFDPTVFTQLHVTNPALWWPFRYGNPELYNLRIWFEIGGVASDEKQIKFGIRQFTDYLTPPIYGNTYKGFKVNGQNILVRGGAYVWDMLIRWDTATNEAHMRYVKDMGLNTIRFEGILGNEEIYDIADREGILLLPGFVCCSQWEKWNGWNTEDDVVGPNSLESQMRLMRHHASALVWAYGSDEAPPTDVLTQYKNIAARLHWQNPTFDNVADWSNPSAGAKMDGPYKWEPPIYWYADTSNGGAFGFCAEQGGESVPPEESLRKFIPPADLWPIGTVYNYHAGSPRSVFDNLTVYSDGVNKRYGTTGSVTQYADRSQLLNYESERAQFEAYGANAYTLSTGTIYWMLNNAWPSVHWNLYDYYFKPGGGFFGTKKALEPVHVIWDYATNKVKVFNSTLTGYTGMTVTARVYNIPNLAQQYANTVTLNVPANVSTEALTIPALTGLSTTYFVRLELKDSTGGVVSNNVYWYSTTPDVLSNKSNWYMTAVKTYANLTGLNSLAANSSVSASASAVRGGGQETVTIVVNNTSASNIAFFMRAEVTKGQGGLEVLPVTYADNYVTLWPGESTTIVAKYATADLGGQPAFVRVRGYNVPEFSVAVP